MKLFDVTVMATLMMNPDALKDLAKFLSKKALTKKSKFFSETSSFVSSKGRHMHAKPLIYDAYISGLLFLIASRFVGRGYQTLGSHLNELNNYVSNYKLKNKSGFFKAVTNVPKNVSSNIIRLYQLVLDDFLTLTGLQKNQPMSALIEYISSNPSSFGNVDIPYYEASNVLKTQSALINLVSVNQLNSILNQKMVIDLSRANPYNSGPVMAFNNNIDGTTLLFFKHA